jgi:arsenical pump membrane protein
MMPTLHDGILGVVLRPFGWREAWWACGGAVILVLGGLLPLPPAGAAIARGNDVYLFLTGMMILSELARVEGVFDWIAGIAAMHAAGCRSRLFLLVYVAGIVVTAFLSNDATAVVLTPAVLTIVRRLEVEPTPHLLACAFIANAASFIFPISNPANLVVFGRHMPALVPWLGMFLLPSIASIAVTFLVMRLVSRRELQPPIRVTLPPIKLSFAGRVAIGGLLLAAAALILASYLGLSLGAPTCGAALLVLGIVAISDRSIVAKVARGVSWSVIPLVAGLFVIVAALEETGVLGLLARGLQSVANLPPILANLSAAFAFALLSNGMNNLPVGLIGGLAMQSGHDPAHISQAVLLGVDLGPNLSVTGSLATILWLIALRRENVKITAWQFLKYGLLVMPSALASAALLLR